MVRQSNHLEGPREEAFGLRFVTTAVQVGISEGVSVTDVQSDAGNQPTSGRPGRKWRVSSRRRDPDRDGVHHTRIGGVWVAVAVATAIGVALIDFIVQNTRSVRVEFFGANGQMPVAVALLGAALAGAFLVLAVGVARTTQLRLAARRGKKNDERSQASAADVPAP
jgi:uncharacterized integral membrane protein